MRAATHADPGHKVTEREMSKMLIGTVLSVLICLVSLVSLTWAWFSDGVVTETVTVTAAYFTVEVRASTDGSSYSDPVSCTNKEYTLPAGTTNIKLTSGGNATKGFFLIEANGKKFHTDTITLNGGASTEIIPVSGVTTETVTIKIIPAWGGIPTGYEADLPQDGISFAALKTASSPKSMPKKKAVKEEAVPENEEEIEEIIEEEIEDIPDEEIIEEEIEIPEDEPEEIPETPSEETPAETPTE